MNRTQTIGIALGGGGARGLAHLPILAVLDEREIRPCCISGTSAGAIIGALYASGKTASQIREWADALIFSKGRGLRDLLKKPSVFKSVEFLDISFQESGLLRGRKFIAALREALGVETFEELDIPLKVVATDFWKQEQVVFDSGDLLKAIRASMSVPGLFTPVEYQDRILVDGGAVNPVPHEILTDCATIIGVDVTGFPDDSQSHIPTSFRCMTGSFDAMQKAIIERGLQSSMPNLLLRPNLKGYELLDFHKNQGIYADAQSAAEELEAWLDDWLKLEI